MARRIFIAALSALALAGPAEAAVTDATHLTPREARGASQLVARSFLGSLITSAGEAGVSVTRCRTAGRRGTCRVVVRGTEQRCTYVSRVRQTGADDFEVWATDLACAERRGS